MGEKDSQKKNSATFIIAAYNRVMGGVALLDRAWSNLRPVICGKDWYWPLLINAINIAFLYSWRLYCIVFSWNYAPEIFHTANCWYHDYQIKATRHQCWFSSKKDLQSGSWWEIWWVRSSSYELLSSEMCCL